MKNLLTLLVVLIFTSCTKNMEFTEPEIKKTIKYIVETDHPVDVLYKNNNKEYHIIVDSTWTYEFEYTNELDTARLSVFSAFYSLTNPVNPRIHARIQKDGVVVTATSAILNWGSEIKELKWCVTKGGVMPPLTF